MGLNKSMKQCLFTFFKSDIYIFKTIVFIFIGRFKNGKKSLEIYFLFYSCKLIIFLNVSVKYESK